MIHQGRRDGKKDKTRQDKTRQDKTRHGGEEERNEHFTNRLSLECWNS